MGGKGSIFGRRVITLRRMLPKNLDQPFIYRFID